MSTLVWIVLAGSLLGYGITLYRYRFSFRTEQDRAEATDQPFVSVLVPVHNDTTHLLQLIPLLQAQTYPKDRWELLVIDDHSTVPVTLPEEYDWVQLIQSEGRGKKAALLTALKQARGSWILTTDADCSPTPRWIEVMAEHMQPKTDLLAGPVMVDEPTPSLLTRFQQWETLALQTLTAGSIQKQEPLMCNGANLAYRKARFETTQPYADNLHLKSGDDTFLMLAFFKEDPESLRYVTDKHAIVRTEPAPDLKTLFRQRLRWSTKLKHYTDASHIHRTGIGLAAGNAAVVISWFLLFLQMPFLPVFAFLKGSMDLWLVARARVFFGTFPGIVSWVFTLLFYPFYLMILTLASALLPAPQNNSKAPA